MLLYVLKVKCVKDGRPIFIDSRNEAIGFRLGLNDNSSIAVFSIYASPSTQLNLDPNLHILDLNLFLFIIIELTSFKEKKKCRQRTIKYNDQHLTKNIKSLSSFNQNNPKLWKILKAMGDETKKDNDYPPIKIGNREVSNESELAKLFSENFSLIFYDKNNSPIAESPHTTPYQSSCELAQITKVEFIEALSQAELNASLRLGFMPFCCCSSTITLIPKKDKPKNDLSSCRPISLINCISKCEISKSILKPVDHALYADDLVIWTTGLNKKEIQEKLQTSLYQMVQFCDKKGLKINKDKITQITIATAGNLEKPKMSFLDIFESLKTQTNNQLGLYLFCCAITVIWTVFVLFFNSRVLGSMATFFINLYLKRYSKTLWIRIRSLSISFLSGKVMFRGIHYVTTDYSLYIQDGWITFAYWKPQFTREKSSSKSKSDKSNLNKQTDGMKRTARLNIFLCNFQLHYYNSFKANPNDTKVEVNSTESSTGTFQNFLKSLTSSTICSFFTRTKNNHNSNQTDYSNPNNNSKLNLVNNTTNQANDYNFTEDLMQLFSVVNIRILKGRVFAGNHTLPSTLNIRFSNAKMELVTEKSQSKVDEYCFILRGDLNKLETSLLLNKKFPNLESCPLVAEKNRDNRVLIFKCTSSDFIYVQDVPSILTFDRRYVQKNEIGELIKNEKEPEWSLKLNCNKQTILNYGPWFDRHRETLWKFFFPASYEILEPQPEPTLNERRQTSKFDFEIVLKDPNTEVNLIFSSSPLIGNSNLENLISSNLKDYSEYQKKFTNTERRLTLKCRNESFLKLSIPWLTKQYGYKTKINGEFNSIQSNTNLGFSEFLTCQKLKLDVDINYPLVWNDLQTWNINLDINKGSIYFVFFHKNFFQELIYDWSSRFMGDIRHFVPYIYKIKFKSNDFEAILPCNQHNWIDTCILENNSFFAVLAKEAYVGLDLCFEEFYPEKTNVILDVKIFDACARFIVPPTNAHLAFLKVLKKNLKYIPFDGAEKVTFESNHWSQFSSFDHETTKDQINSTKNSKSKKNINQSKSKNVKSDLNNKNHVRFNKSLDSNLNHLVENWIECWQAKNASVVLNFEYFPCPLLDWNNKNLPSVCVLKSLNSPNFDCEIFKPDTIFLDIEIGPSLVMLYGTFLKRLWYIKEAYFSWDQFFTEMAKNLEQLASFPNAENFNKVSKSYYDTPTTSLLTCNHKDPRNFRPLSVKLALAIHNINGHLVLDTTEGAGYTPFPIGFTKLLALELDKNYSETKLQLFVEPVNIFIEDLVDRKYDKNLHQGHLCLSSVQVRGHAMFSDEKRLKTDTLEYAWLLEILLGDVTGAVTPVQVEQLLHGLESFFILLFEDEYQLKSVYLDRTDPGLPYKYEVTRFSLDLIDIYLIESGTALNFNLHPVRLSLCNSHTNDYAKGLSACIGEFYLKLFINEASRSENENASVYTSTSSKKSYLKSRIKKNTNIDSVSNLSQQLSSSSSTSSLSSISISTLNSSNATLNLNRSSSDQTLIIDDHDKKDESSDSDDINSSIQKIPNSDEFNYWFECSSLSSGRITIDLALDKGNPDEQLEFLRTHDLKTKRLFFLWNDYKINTPKICGCVGGCNFYSVFDYTNRLNELNPDNFDFFNLQKSITRCNPDFGMSLFYPNSHILESQPIMYKNYPIESYEYNQKLESSFDVEKQRINETFIGNIRPETISIKKSNLSLEKSHRRSSKNRLSVSMSTLSPRRPSKASVLDDYYTADEEDEKIDMIAQKRKTRKIPRNSVKSLQSSKSSSKSKQSYFSMAQLNSSQPSESIETAENTLKLNLNEEQKKTSSYYEGLEPKMDLNFDIKRPILDSSLPKYCYLKYLSRAFVQNWNKSSAYPYYDDFTNKNIFFTYRKKGIDLTNIVFSDYQTRSHGKIESSLNDDSDDNVIKSRINLKFKSFECYITPLSLTGLTRFTESLKLYQVDPNSMITSLQSKAYTNCVAESIIEAISKTQVSLKIPQIRLFSLQCGLAEGDKISNAFVSTLTNPDEFITLSLFTVCIYSIETQLIDSQNKTSAIFMIDKIDTQFCRLYDSENLKKILASNDGTSVFDQEEKIIKLSCISNENSKTSIRYLKGSNNLQCLIMQECVLDRISIKAIKRLNDQNDSKCLNNKLSICEFDISNIWFSCPEPPSSPKGKRKIPFSRFDWNLLSSVSPAVISWLCASKDCIKSIKELFKLRTTLMNNIIAAFLIGTFKNRDFLQSALDCKIYNLKSLKFDNSTLTSRSKNSKIQKIQADFNLENFLKIYLTDQAYRIHKDPSCNLVNLLRNYLLYFSDELEEAKLYDRDPKNIINETLLNWSLGLKDSEKHEKYAEKYSSLVTNLNEKNEIITEVITQNNNNNNNDNKNKMTSSDESIENLNEKSSDESSVLKPINGLHLQKTNKIFKPILSYIGIDAPSGTLMDNLFKELGSLLFGNLNIKSLQINILGSFGIKNNLIESDPELSNCFKLKPKNVDLDQKIITTILSFNDLLFNLNVRQVVSEGPKNEHTNLANSLSMPNPLYIPDKPIDPKYFTKIDAGIKVNNLTQEVNMPLLRLAHQIYSIIADAVDLEKENSKLNSTINLKDEPHLRNMLEKKASVKNLHHIKHGNAKKDYFAFKDKSHVSFFGWLNIKNINFKAGVGNLALNGEMKNLQSTVLMGRKIIGSSSKLEYDGSLNIRMDSTFGKLAENDKKINVVLLNIGKSHLFGYLNNKSLFSSFLHVGMINVDVPIQPILVHGVVIRESKVIEQKILPEIKNFAIFENTDENLKDDKQNTNQDKPKNKTDFKSASFQVFSDKNDKNITLGSTFPPRSSNQTVHDISEIQSKKTLSRNKKHQMSISSDSKKSFIHQLKLNFKSKFDGLEIRAKLLETPCLKAAYLVENVECTLSLTSKQSKFNCIINKHSLSFQCDDEINDEDLKSTFMTMKPLNERTYFYLPTISLNGNHLSKYLENQLDNSKNTKCFNLSEVKFHVYISGLTRELNAEVIAQLVFVTKVFLKEINNILQAVYGVEDPDSIANTPRSAKSTTPTNFSFQVQNQNLVYNYFFYDFKIEMSRISLTGITPSNTALTIYTSDKSSLTLNNLKNNDGITSLKIEELLDKNFDFTLKPSVEAKSQLSVELKKSFSDTDGWYQLAYFDTKFDLKNEIKKTTNSDRESIVITVEKPRFYLQPGAVDCGILFWLNYKSTYEFWLQQRQQFSTKTEKDFIKNTASPINFTQNSEKNISDNFLTLKLRVTGLGVALPLSSKMSKSFFSTSTDCLVISLNETAIYACSSGCVVSKGQFNNFCLRFIENFNLANSDWAPNNNNNISDNKFPNVNFHYRNLMNSWIVPSGYYEVCSSTVDKSKSFLNSRNDPANILKNAPIWILSVKWKMEGLDINLDTNIGKWLSKLGDTVTRLAETQSIKDTSCNDQDIEIKRLREELNECLERGETSKVNTIQSRIDILSLASYPEKAKQIFVKTKNNLIKGQIGFNLNQLQSPSTPVKSPNDNRYIAYNINSASEKIPSFRQLQPSNRRHSFSNDDLNNTLNSRSIYINSPILLEENETDLQNSTCNLNKPQSTPNESRKSQLIPTQAPSIDFKLSVKIEISSGKCVLHANKGLHQQGKRTNNYMSSPMAGGYFSPDFMRGFTGNLTPNVSPNYQETDSRNTNFIFPAINVQTFYESTHKKSDELVSKKASLYAMIKIESFAFPSSARDFYNREMGMVISPALLDFLEQTLEPLDLKPSIPTPDAVKSKFNKAESLEDDFVKKKSSIVVPENKEHSYFPIDVIVFVSMKPSSIRFTCLPQSTMECLLKLPSVEMVFSTSRINQDQKLEDFLHMENDETFTTINTNSSSNDGGLNLTCSLSDFSLRFYNRLAIRNPLDPRFYYNDQGVGYTEEKDSLSVRVAYIKVNISRNKRNFFRSKDHTEGLNEVKLSILADVGNTSFIYDMRNIKEVFVFPKIWYRRSFARRIIFGDDLTSSNMSGSNERFKSTQNKSETKISSDQSIKVIKRPKSLDLDAEHNRLYNLSPNWKTLVLISINLAGLEVRMNIGSILGSVCLFTKNGRFTSKISLSRFGPKDMVYNFSIENTNLTAEGGLNRIQLRIQDINTAIKMNENDKKTLKPSHKIEFGIYATECRVESAYNQASPIFILRFSNLNVKLSDSWFNHMDQIDRLPEALVDLNITWDQFHLMMTRSTTADLIILYYRLIEYFDKQFAESKDYIKECELDLFYEMKVKQQFIEKKETFVDKKFSVNGGNINLKGNNFTLTTFHGNSCKAIKWAVFSLNEPEMDFASQSHSENGILKSQQNLIFYLGRNTRKKDMASIYSVYRDSTNIFPKLQTVTEWFDYAHSSIDAVGLRDFPSFSSEEHPLLLTQVLKKKTTDQTKWEDIFQLPCVQIFCSSTIDGNNVKFDFKTEFHDHIQLTLKTELFGFLHQLITSYTKETDVLRSKEPNIPIAKKDERDYECVRWELEPTLRLISKFGSSVEPPGVDGLLKSLGFSHAKSTIPKWLQRGLLDNLDEVMQGLIKIYVKILSDFNPSRIEFLEQD
ncbi:unnamed protein product [Brachionus calyciflorus]|uniref:Bridge-like lipid transfer protein family member 1 C-terminal domain-containing protein n=1 Tax=Brachionus calyciflorus TaxID=104777 RepID=A0A813UPX9_9BILA|nr:unnamed protein product [Brachionus calyciflorus]